MPPCKYHLPSLTDSGGETTVKLCIRRRTDTSTTTENGSEQTRVFKYRLRLFQPWIPLFQPCVLQTLPDELTRNEASWKTWYAENEPEEVPVPSFEGRLAADPSVGAFYRLLLIRWRFNKTLRRHTTSISARSCRTSADFSPSSGVFKYFSRYISRRFI